jgi:hypothetical protein
VALAWDATRGPRNAEEVAAATETEMKEKTGSGVGY